MVFVLGLQERRRKWKHTNEAVFSLSACIGGERKMSNTKTNGFHARHALVWQESCQMWKHTCFGVLTYKRNAKHVFSHSACIGVTRPLWVVFVCNAQQGERVPAYLQPTHELQVEKWIKTADVPCIPARVPFVPLVPPFPPTVLLMVVVVWW